jgi:DNA gyrase inhibitor GyrI
MPQDFNNCVKNNGKVITKKLKNGRYVRICFDKKGKAYTGEIKMIKKSKAKHSSKKKTNDPVVLAKDLLRLKSYFDENYRNGIG